MSIVVFAPRTCVNILFIKISVNDDTNMNKYKKEFIFVQCWLACLIQGFEKIETYKINL